MKTVLDVENPFSEFLDLQFIWTEYVSDEKFVRSLGQQHQESWRDGKLVTLHILPRLVRVQVFH